MEEIEIIGPPERETSDHRIAIQRFDGSVEIIQANELRICVPTKKCIQFWLTCVGCLLAVIIGVFFMIYEGSESNYFPIGAALLGTGIGGLVPSPNYAEILPKPVK
jgi:hypothetical protein